MELKIGTMLIMEPTYTERPEKFRCKVVELDEGTIFIDYPINVATKKTAFLVDGAEFRVIFQTAEKQSYSFRSTIIGRKGGNIPMMLLVKPPEKDFVKIQRREYVRVETPIDVAVEKNGHYYQFVAEDISAGGMALRINSIPPFKEDDEVFLTIVLPFMKQKDIRYVQTGAQVIRFFEESGIRFASLRFTDTDDIDKQYIVRLCFERQITMRKKELNE